MSVKKVKVEIDTACGHDVKPLDPVKLKKKNKDELAWRITNDCPSDQDVLFCVYDAATGDLVDPHPFDRCTSKPPGLKVGETFTVKSKKEARLKCTGKIEGQYKKRVLVGTEASGGCPLKLPGIRTHMLDVEILP